MISRYKLWPYYIIGLSLILLQFQNCGKMPESQIESLVSDQNTTEDATSTVEIPLDSGNFSSSGGSSSGGSSSGGSSSGGSSSGGSSSGGSSSTACSSGKLIEVLETATSAKSFVKIDCDLTLKKSDTVTKRLIFEGSEASNRFLECNGATLLGNGSTNDGKDMIAVQSKKMGSQYSRPENISISNCVVKGSIRVIGLGANGQASEVKSSSKSTGHTQRAQAAAPRKITFDKLTIYGANRVPFYISPGSTYVKIQNSNFSGTSSSVVIYLDAESANNTIHNNTFSVSTQSRELIAIDGSSNNTISKNYFSGLNHGGIYLYRNCGEGGTVRHQTPSNNWILENTFYYANYNGEKPSIWLSSRDGQKQSYCNEDNGYPFGSSASNLDYAKLNTIFKNKIKKLPVGKMILQGSSASANVISSNFTE